MLTRIMPVSSPSTTVSAESTSRVNTDVTSPNGTPLEIATACSADSARRTVTIGPKTSSCASFASGDWPSTTVGVRNRPGPSIAVPPVTTRPPSAATARAASSTSSRAGTLITGPTTVSASAGSPIFSPSTAATSASVTSPVSPTTITRPVAVHFWPA